MHWITCNNENYFDYFGCPQSSFLWNYIIKRYKNTCFLKMKTKKALAVVQFFVAS